MVAVGGCSCNRSIVVSASRADCYSRIVIIQVVSGVIGSTVIVVGCARRSIICAVVIFCGVIDDVVIFGKIIIYDLVSPPVINLKPGRIASLHSTDHLLDTCLNFKFRPFFIL